MSVNHYVRLNEETDIKTIEALEDLHSTGKFKSINALLVRCIGKGLPLVYAETFDYASSKRGTPADAESDIKRLLKMQQKETASLSIMLEIMERLMSFCYNSAKEQRQNISHADEVEMCQLPERLAEIKRKALRGFRTDDDNT